MNFRSEINFNSPDFLIEHTDKIFSTGSCFAENISSILIEKKFTVLSNPFGVLYNPVSISNSIINSIDSHKISEEEIVFNQGEWHSFFHHSDFSTELKNELIKNANKSFQSTFDFLKTVDKIIITYGTANIYRHKQRNLIVSNCHKLPQKEFENFMLSVDDVKNYTQGLISRLEKFNPNIKFIFSVSPVRHLKDGFEVNSQSKSTLILGIREAIQSKANCFYFPAFEILMDDLRDYRFYKEDLVHPNEIAVKYIWEIFSKSLLSNECKKMISEIDQIFYGFKHRIRNSNSAASQKFIRKTLEKIYSITASHSELNFSDEIEYFKKKIKSDS